jgi:hypothetical protein
MNKIEEAVTVQDGFELEDEEEIKSSAILPLIHKF